jgi:predicted DNA-binding transcriptional regulator AlpA
MLINMRQVTLLKSLSKLTIYSILDKSEYYDLNYPKSIKISKNRDCWFIWEINQWIEAKMMAH